MSLEIDVNATNYSNPREENEYPSIYPSLAETSKISNLYENSVQLQYSKNFTEPSVPSIRETPPPADDPVEETRSNINNLRLNLNNLNRQAFQKFNNPLEKESSKFQKNPNTFDDLREKLNKGLVIPRPEPIPECKIFVPEGHLMIVPKALTAEQLKSLHLQATDRYVALLEKSLNKTVENRQNAFARQSEYRTKIQPSQQKPLNALARPISRTFPVPATNLETMIDIATPAPNELPRKSRLTERLYNAVATPFKFLASYRKTPSPAKLPSEVPQPVVISSFENKGIAVLPPLAFSATPLAPDAPPAPPLPVIISSSENKDILVLPPLAFSATPLTPDAPPAPPLPTISFSTSKPQKNSLAEALEKGVRLKTPLNNNAGHAKDPRTDLMSAILKHPPLKKTLERSLENGNAGHAKNSHAILMSAILKHPPLKKTPEKTPENNNAAKEPEANILSKLRKKNPALKNFSKSNLSESSNASTELQKAMQQILKKRDVIAPESDSEWD